MLAGLGLLVLFKLQGWSSKPGAPAFVLNLAIYFAEVSQFAIDRMLRFSRWAKAWLYDRLRSMATRQHMSRPFGICTFDLPWPALWLIVDSSSLTGRS